MARMLWVDRIADKITMVVYGADTKSLETQFKSSSIRVSILHWSFNDILMKITDYNL